MIPQHRGGSESKLNKEQLERADQVLQQSPRENGYNKSNGSMMVLKCWISRGSRKRKIIYGAANPKTGEVFYSTEDAGNSDGFESFLIGQQSIMSTKRFPCFLTMWHSTKQDG